MERHVFMHYGTQHIKMPVLPKLIDRFNTFPIKYEQDYF